MHILLKENLEGYLSGNLQRTQFDLLESHLAECAECRAEWGLLYQSALQVRTLRAPTSLDLEPRAGFYGRVIDRIDGEREIPFWTMLVDPAFGRRVVFACLVLLALLGGYVAVFEPTNLQHRPEAMLAGDPAPLPSPRLGPDLERNRGVVLATLAADGD